MSATYKIIKNFVSDKFSPELKEKIWGWLIDSNGQAEKEEAMMQLWEEQNIESDESTIRSYRNFQKKISPYSRGKVFSYVLRKWGQVAAALLIPLLSVWIAYLYVRPEEKSVELVENFVPKGKQRKVTLSDGSVVYLNSGTLLIYPQTFSDGVRSVYLVGEANFDVKKDKEHPFVVKTAYQKVKVLGTKFNVHAYPEDGKTITTLESGSVVVQKEQLEYDNSTGEFQKRNIDSSLFSGWTKGELNFVGMTLKDIFATVERIYNIHIIVPPHLVTTDVYTVKFKHKTSIRDVMNIITKTIGDIDYRVEDEDILLIYSPTK